MPLETTSFNCESICHHIIAQTNRHSKCRKFTYMIPQKKIHDWRRIPPIEGVQQYGSNSTIHPM